MNRLFESSLLLWTKHSNDIAIEWCVVVGGATALRVVCCHLPEPERQFVSDYESIISNELRGENDIERYRIEINVLWRVRTVHMTVTIDHVTFAFSKVMLCNKHNCVNISMQMLCTKLKSDR